MGYERSRPRGEPTRPCREPWQGGRDPSTRGPVGNRSTREVTRNAISGVSRGRSSGLSLNVL